MNNWMTVIRRLIIIVFAILLVPRLYDAVFENKGNIVEIEDSLQKLIDIGQAEIYRYEDKKMTIDQDIFKVQRLIVSTDTVYVHYSYQRTEPAKWAWSFPNGAVKLIDDQGRELMQRGSGSSGRWWGEIGEINFDRPDSQLFEITLIFDWFDREETLKLPLDKGGDADE